MSGGLGGVVRRLTAPLHRLFSASHSDVDASVTPADGDALTYVAATGKWTPQAPGGGGGLDETTGIKVVKVTLTDADLLALDSTPFELLPAPAAGVLLTPLGVVTRRTGSEYTGTPTIVFVSDPLLFEWGETSASSLGLTTSGTRYGSLFWAQQPLADVPTASVAAKPLLMAAVGGALTVGSGSLDVWVYYSVLS
jgi:hypothetical protein